MSHINDRSLSFNFLKKVIDGEKLAVHFQPVLSARNHSIIGYEGLIRGKNPDNSLISPVSLFEAAKKYGCTLEFDRLCREKVLAAFSDICNFKGNTLLFLNLETSFLSADVVGSGYLLDQVIRHHVPPANVVIEIVESRTDDVGALIRFVNSYRNSGFSIALDDVGSGHSNFDRISLLRPNIIKVDRSIISGITTDYFKQEIFKSLTNLSKNIGALTLAEGVETLKEVMKCIELGADLLQGYFFSRPRDISPEDRNSEEQMLADTLRSMRNTRINDVRTKRLLHKHYQMTARRIVRTLQDKYPDEFDAVLKEIIEQTDNIDALYVISDEGIQVTHTFIRDGCKTKINPVFRAASKNENLSYKDYFYQLINTDLKKYTTDRYISFATGNLCVTLSHVFKAGDGCRHILCIDFLADPQASLSAN